MPVFWLGIGIVVIMVAVLYVVRRRR